VRSRIICRCEEISEEEIIQAVRAGCRSVAEVKRFCRAGMGLCQGRTCGPLVASIIARELGVPKEVVETDTPRFPLFPVALEAFCEEAKD